MRGGLAGLLLLSLVVAAEPVARAGVVPAEDGMEVLERAAARGQEVPYRAEAIEIRYVDETTHVTRRSVQQHDDGLVVDGDGGRVDLARRIALPVATRQGDLPHLETKYRVTSAGIDYIMDRPCARLDVHRRTDGILRERLWVDEGSGLLVKRETFGADGETLRVSAYLSLDLRPRGATPPEPATVGRQAPAALPVSDDGLTALRRAGWQAPELLAGEYRRVAAFAVAGGQPPPLHLIYTDGLYTLSLFEVPGMPEPSTMPPGATRVEGVGHPVYEWREQSPTRLVWGADATTYTIVGDAPRDDLLAVAASLPAPQRDGVVGRVGRGLRRLWSIMSPWG